MTDSSKEQTIGQQWPIGNDIRLVHEEKLISEPVHKPNGWERFSHRLDEKEKTQSVREPEILLQAINTRHKSAVEKKDNGMPPSTKKTPVKRKWKPWVKWVLLGVAVLLTILLGWAYWRLFHGTAPIVDTPVGQAVTGVLQPADDREEEVRLTREREVNNKPFPLLASKPKLEPLVSDTAVNLLIMARDVEANLYDTILLVSLDPENGEVRLLNLPRDLYVDYSPEAAALIRRRLPNLNQDPGLRKINAAHKLGHLIGYREDNPRFGSSDYDFTADLVEEMFSLHVDDFMFVHQESFQQIVDAFGGVRMDITQGMRYSDPVQNLKIDIKPGVQVLKGNDAEGFVRFRKGTNENGRWYEIGDLGRKENQNLFVEAFLDQHLKLGNIGKFIDLANRYTEFVDTSVMEAKRIAFYAQVARDLILAQFTTANIELETRYQQIYGTSHLVVGEGLTNPPRAEGGAASPAPLPEAKAPVTDDVGSDVTELEPGEGEVLPDEGTGEEETVYPDPPEEPLPDELPIEEEVGEQPSPTDEEDSPG